MKRSKMLENLVFSIELHAGSDPSWLEHDAKMKQHAYDYAHKILRDLEEAGMLPPSYQLRIKNTGIRGAVAATRIDGKWEPEDEEE